MKQPATSARKSAAGKARFSPLVEVRYLQWENCFEVTFESGCCYRIDDERVRKANGISGAPGVEAVWVDQEYRSGFHIRYRDGQRADCAWDFVVEDAPSRDRP